MSGRTLKRHHKKAQEANKSKRYRPPVMELQRTISSASHEFRVDYEQAKHLAIGKAIHSDAFSAGGHMWRLNLYPRGCKESDNGEYLGIFVKLLHHSRSVSAIFEAFLMDKDGLTGSTAGKRLSAHLFQTEDWGWSQFVSHADLVKHYMREGHIRFICTILVLSDNSIPVPPSDIGKHLGTLLDSTDGADVSFIVDGETFHAHRAVLASRSPVFKAELLGSMAEATMPSITLHDIAPAAFRVMLQFIYTDALPADNELGASTFETMRHLLAAADRYALDRLKLTCAQKLWDDVSVDTVAATLACAEMYNCLELKNKCIDFFAVEKNFKKAVLTKGFVQLVQQFPSIISELR